MDTVATEDPALTTAALPDLEAQAPTIEDEAPLPPSELYFRPDTGGFYDTGIHGPASDGATVISREEHADLLDAQATGKVIVAGPNGKPVAVDPASLLSPQEALAQAKDQAKKRAVAWIEQFLGRFTEGYPTHEVQAWPSKLAAARRFQEDGTEADILTIEANRIGKAVADIVPGIVIKGTLLENISAEAAGMRRNLFEGIDAATDADDLPDLLDRAMRGAEQQLAEVLSHGG
jgi:hypothetical protein